MKLEKEIERILLPKWKGDPDRFKEFVHIHVSPSTPDPAGATLRLIIDSMDDTGFASLSYEKYAKYFRLKNPADASLNLDCDITHIDHTTIVIEDGNGKSNVTKHVFHSVRFDEDGVECFMSFLFRNKISKLEIDAMS